MRDARPSYVYFIRRADGEGPVKIGCSVLPERRLLELAVWAPYPLTIAATVKGDFGLESRFHAHFRHLWSHYEWFHPAPELTLAVAQIALGCFDLSILPAKGRRLTKGCVGREWTDGQKLRHRVSFLQSRSGIFPSDDLGEELRRCDDLDDAARAAVRERVLAFLADPLAHGSLAPWPWARNAYAKWAQKHGAPPLPKPAPRQKAA